MLQRSFAVQPVLPKQTFIEGAGTANWHGLHEVQLLQWLEQNKPTRNKRQIKLM